MFKNLQITRPTSLNGKYALEDRGQIIAVAPGIENIFSALFDKMHPSYQTVWAKNLTSQLGPANIVD